MFIMALSVTAPNWKQLKCPTISKWLKNCATSKAQNTNLWLQRGKGVTESKLGVWDQQIQTTTCKIDKTRSYCTVQGTTFSIL